MEQNQKPSEEAKKQNLVENIFNRPKIATGKTSAIFTHSKKTYKVKAPEKKSVFSHSKPLPPAIDIGTSSIKLLQLSESDKGILEVSSIDQENYSQNKNFSISSRLKICLEKIIARNKIGPHCLTALSLRDMQLYNMAFPPIADSELNTAVKYKLAQLRPFNLDVEKIVFKFIKWDHLGIFTKASQQRILVVCAPQDVVKSRISLFQEVGLKPITIGISPIDLISARKFYEVKKTKPDEVVLWLELGAEETFVTVEIGGYLCFCRSLTITSKQMTRAIAKHLRINEDEAEELKKTYGISSWSAQNKEPASSNELSSSSPEKSQVIYKVLISFLENLVADVEHSFKYFSYQIAQSQITKYDRLILSGGGANLKNIDQFLSSKLRVSVEYFNPLAMFRVSPDLEGQKGSLLNIPSSFTVCTGLSVGEKVEDALRIDFLPSSQKKGSSTVANALKKTPVQLVLASFIILIALLSFQLPKVIYYKSELDALTKGIKSSKYKLSGLQNTQLELAEEEANLLNEKSLLEARANLLISGFRKPEEFSRILALMASLLPEDIWVNEIEYENGKFTITGSTSDITLITELIDKFRDSAEFIDQDFSYSEKDTDSKVYSFEITTVAKT